MMEETGLTPFTRKIIANQIIRPKVRAFGALEDVVETRISDARKRMEHLLSLSDRDKQE